MKKMLVVVMAMLIGIFIVCGFGSSEISMSEQGHERESFVEDIGEESTNNTIGMSKWEIIFGAATLIGTAVGIWQTIKVKKQEKDLEKYKFLFDAAEKSIEKEKTIEELEILKNEKQMMDEAIKTELPKRAHLTVLSDRFKDDEKNVVTYYKRFTETKEEYEQLQGEVHTEIPESILKEIENQIMPQYLIKEERDACMRGITIIAYVASFFSVFNSTKILTRLLLAATIFPLLRLWQLTLPKDLEKRKEYLLTTGFALLAVIGTVLFVGSAITYFAAMPYNDNVDIFILLSMLGLLLLLLAGGFYVSKVFKKHKKSSGTEGKDNRDKVKAQDSHKQ